MEILFPFQESVFDTLGLKFLLQLIRQDEPDVRVLNILIITEGDDFFEHCTILISGLHPLLKLLGKYLKFLVIYSWFFHFFLYR